MTIVSSFHYDHRKRIATLLTQPDGAGIDLRVYNPATFNEFKNFDPDLAPCILKFRKPELARFAASGLGATRIGTVVFVQSSIAKIGIMWPLSTNVFFRRTFEPWKLLQEEVDNNGSLWTEVQTVGAESQQLKYNMIHNPKSQMPAALYDMFTSGKSLFIRLKSMRDKDSISPNPYVFTETGLKTVKIYFPFEEGDMSNEIQSFLTQLA